jgi:hypothetical protein
MDHLEQYYANISFRVFRYLKFNFHINHEHRKPQYNFSTNRNQKFTLSSLGLHLKFAYNEKFVSSMGQRFSMGTNYPVANIYFEHGFKNIFGSDFQYNKIEGSLEKEINSKNLGKTSIRFESGYVDNKLPYSLLFTGEGSYDQYISVVIPNTFQTMEPYEFLSDFYSNLFFSHDFGTRLFKTKHLAPRIVIVHNTGYGKLRNQSYYEGIPFSTKEKIYLESGVILRSLVKVKFAGLVYFGLGGGVFYRYGPYSFSTPLENCAFKIAVNISTK